LALLREELKKILYEAVLKRYFSVVSSIKHLVKHLVKLFSAYTREEKPEIVAFPAGPLFAK
jgi:hypothetical protein